MTPCIADGGYGRVRAPRWRARVRGGRACIVVGALALGACAAPGDGVSGVALPGAARSDEASPDRPPQDERAAGIVADEATGDATRRSDDADGDGIDDADDDCPATPPGEIVDAAGCPLFTRVLDDVVFATNDYRLGEVSRQALRRLAADLEAHPDVVLRLEGHTDNRGKASGNLELSKRRVMAVARFLVANGVAPARLKPYGYGESRPRVGNATESGRERNRRIEIGRLSGPDTLAEPAATGQNATDAE